MTDLNAHAISATQLLTSHQLKVATSESCTGGFLAKILTDIPHASAWFDRGFIVYSELSKQELLGVKQKTLTQHGAVSQETALEMAEGTLLKSHADISIAITGVAGPTGGTINHPVGQVWIAFASAKWGKHVKSFYFEGDRENIRIYSVLSALKELEALLKQHY